MVEPKESSPEHHGDIFHATLSHLLTPRRFLMDSLAPPRFPTAAEPFDLVTFPEAFLPIDVFLGFLQTITHAPLHGCIHVGLRSTDNSSYMFRAREVQDALDSIGRIPGVVVADLGPFQDWLSRHTQEATRINVGCLLTKDANGALRICLHPKGVRSKWEFSTSREDHMHEADLLSIVTLQPRDRRFLNVNIQPVLCSDVLHRDRDDGRAGPLEAVTEDASCFGEHPPDHIDLVTVAVCSPQAVAAGTTHQRVQLQWHDAFLNTFVRAASEQSLSRHRHAAFVLSNFRTFPGPPESPAGLSGVFLPLPLRRDQYPSFLSTFNFGKATTTQNSWTVVDETSYPAARNQSLGHIVALSSQAFGEEVSASLFGFTIHRLPREANRWQGVNGVVDTDLVDFVGGSLTPRPWQARGETP